MIKLFSRTVFVILLILICTLVFFAQKKKSKKISNGEHLITALANSKTLPGLFRDDSGLLAEGPKGISPDVIRILKLGKLAIPLLIRHLDDKRILKGMVFCCSVDNDDTQISVGDGVLSILLVIIRSTEPIYDTKCVNGEREFEDSMESCVREKYLTGKNMKRNWLKAYRAGKINYKKYEY